MWYLIFVLSFSDAVFTNGQSVDYLFVGNIVYTVSYQNVGTLGSYRS